MLYSRKSRIIVQRYRKTRAGEISSLGTYLIQGQGCHNLVSLYEVFTGIGEMLKLSSDAAATRFVT